MAYLRPTTSKSDRTGRRTSGAARTALGAAAILVFLAGSGWAAGSPAEKGKDAVVPVPERGVLYVRYGTPGGVRILSLRRPVPSRTLAPAEVLPSTRAEQLARILREELALLLLSGVDQAACDEPRAPGAAEVLMARQGAPAQVDRGRFAAIAPPAGAPSIAPPAAAPPTAVATPDTTPVATSGTAGPDSTDHVAPGADTTPVPVSPDLADLSAEEAAVELQASGMLRTTRIRFAYDHADILVESEPALRTLAEVLERNQEWRVRVEGHADKRGDECYNLGLSGRRAEAVARILADRYGIAPHRLKAIGFGETLPLIDEETEEAYAANRRVEFRLMD